ncbi:hypothetical protein BDP27DRAFT_1440203 [Rhodocollybia butyracea]|uniref:Uncharacterized protein n=1 Tax=Rhodocollybia butyracea TaxID=206335 RepID=A0A9P5P453_9AGAR|nr:hypothetical protein BDP27DRAFT_1440203 [Rhodocollybia butyracea]
MSEAAHRSACFKIHSVETSFILEHAGIFESTRAEVRCSLCRETASACIRPDESLTCNLCHKRKKQCDFFTLLRFCAYANLEGIHVSEAVARLRGAPKILDFPAELYKKALKVLEARSNRPSELGRIMDERERLFPQADEDTERLRQFIATDRAQDPSRGGVVVEKRRKHPKKMKKAKNPEKLRDVPSSQSHDRHGPLRVLIPALPRVAAPVPLAPIPLPTIVSPTSPPHPSSSTDPSLRTKRAAPVEADSNRNVRPRLDNSIPLAPTRAPVDMGKMIPHVPLPSQDLNAQFHSRGYNLEQQSFLADFVGNHRSTVQELQEERDRAARYRSERDHLRQELAEVTSRSAGFEAEAHVERTRAELLAVQLKESTSSSAVLRKEFLKSRERTKELEQRLAENRRLRASEDHLREELKRAEGTFEAIQSKEALESQLREARYEMSALGNMLKSAAGSSNDSLVRKLQSDRELLILERNIALEYALMLRQLDLPGFINRFEQRVTETRVPIVQLVERFRRSRRGRFSSVCRSAFRPFRRHSFHY